MKDFIVGLTIIYNITKQQKKIKAIKSAYLLSYLYFLYAQYLQIGRLF